MFHARALGSLSLLLTSMVLGAVACSSGEEGAEPKPDGSKAVDTDDPRDDDAAPGPTNPGPSTPDAGVPGDDASVPGGPARCGTTPYQWREASEVGAVLETKNLASHSIIELNYAIREARRQGYKTDRIARYKTRSRVLRYQTQNRGELVDATTTIAYPDRSGTFPIMLVLHGTVGFNDDCAPSRHLTEADFGGFASETGILLSVFASLGYIVVAPDYLGLKSLGDPSGYLHPYLVAEPTAIASIDSIRATKKYLETTGPTPGELVVMGGSQGGHAAAFVNRYAPHYAPELDIKGGVWDVPPTDILNQAPPALRGWENATKNIIAFVSTAHSWYHPGSTLESALAAPFISAVPEYMNTNCKFSGFLADATLETVFNPAFRTASQTEPPFDGYAPWECYLQENSLSTTSVPKQDSVPSLFLLGELDDLVNNEVERAAFETLCDQGHVLQYLECAGATHTKPLSYALDQWLDFLEDRLAGKPVQSACQLKAAERCTSTPDDI